MVVVRARMRIEILSRTGVWQSILFPYGYKWELLGRTCSSDSKGHVNFSETGAGEELGGG